MAEVIAWWLPTPETAELVAWLIGGAIAVFWAIVVLLVLYVLVSAVVFRK